MRTLASIALCALALGLTTSTPTPSNAALLTVGGNSTFGGTSCADVTGANPDPNTPVQVWSCHGAGNQQFDLNYRFIHAMALQQCLSVTSIASGAAVVTESCTGSANEQWFYLDGAIHLYENVVLCLDAGSDANGTPLTVQPCVTGKPSQFWQYK